MALVTTRLELRFNNVLERQRLEIRFNNVLDRKETFFNPCVFFSKKSLKKVAFFEMGLTHALGKKIPNFSLFRFGQIPVFSYFFCFQNRIRNNVY